MLDIATPEEVRRLRWPLRLSPTTPLLTTSRLLVAQCARRWSATRTVLLPGCARMAEIVGDIGE